MSSAVRTIQQPNTYSKATVVKDQTDNSQHDPADITPPPPPLLVPKQSNTSRMTARTMDSRVAHVGQQLSVIKDRYKDESDHCQICRLKGKRKLSGFYCTTCNMPLCLSCGAQHKETEVTSQHDIVARKQQDGSVAVCSTHNFAAVKFWCETCSQLICVNCTMIDHKNHQLMDIAIKLDECRQMVVMAMSDLDTKIVACDRQLKKTADIEAGIEQNRDLVKKHITAVVTDLKHKLDLQQHALLKELDVFVNMRLDKLYKSRDIIQRRFDDMMAVRIAGESYKSLTHGDKVITHALQLLRQGGDIKEPQGVDEREFTGLSFALTNNEELGVVEETDKSVIIFQGHKIKNSDKLDQMLQPANRMKADVVRRLTDLRGRFTAKILSKFKTIAYLLSPTAIAMLPSGKFLIADSSSSGLLICDQSGRYQQKILVHDVPYPGGLAVTKTGNIAVSTDKYIKIFKPGGQKVGQFSAPPSPGAIHIDDNGNFLVNDANSKHVTIFSPDGQILRRFYAGDKMGYAQETHSLSASGSQISLSYQHYLNFFLKIFSYEGHLLNSYKLPEACGGVQMDRFGNIIAAAGDLCYIAAKDNRVVPLAAIDKAGNVCKLLSRCVAFTSEGQICTLHVNPLSKRSEFVLLELTPGLLEVNKHFTARGVVNWSGKSPLPTVTPRYRPPSL